MVQLDSAAIRWYATDTQGGYLDPSGRSNKTRSQYRHEEVLSMAGSYVNVTDQDFEQQVLKSPEPVIVDYWAPWCGPCRAMAPVFEQMSVEYAGRLRFAKMNTDENPDTPIKYGIQGIPTVIFFKDGREVNRMVGFGGPTALKRVIESVLATA
jgi:thioredoxin 1